METRRLQRQQEFEARVAMGVDQYEAQRQAHTVIDSDPETEGDDDGDEIWQDFDDPEVLEQWLKPQPLPKKEREEPPKNIEEATGRLARFHYIKEEPEALLELLDARADPNFVLGEGDISLLLHAISFSRPENVGKMRDLLLQYGAVEGKRERERWFVRQYTDEHDAEYVRKFHRDDREG